MHDAQVRVAIAGAGGRMGRQLIQATLQMDGVALGAALEREGSSLLGVDAGELAGTAKTGVTVQSSLEAVKEDFDVFSTAREWSLGLPGLMTRVSRPFRTRLGRSLSFLRPTSASASM